MTIRMYFPLVVLVGILSTSCGLTVDFLPVTRTSQPDQEVEMPNISEDLLNQAFKEAEQDLEKRRELEENLNATNLILGTSKAVEARHQRFLAFREITGYLDFNSSLLSSGSLYLKKQLGLSNEQCTFGLKNVSFPSDSKWNNTRQQCFNIFKEDHCDFSSKFRTLDGSCNNKDHPSWGRALTCMSRLLPPEYNDGISVPRKSKSGEDLPKVREISLQVHEALVTPNATHTHMMMQFGQFVTHDVTLGLMTRTMGNHTMINCCPVGANNHEECILRIEIPSNPKDFYSQNNQTCMNFVRSSLCNRECGFGPRQHSTQITHYVDGSNIYGSVPDDVVLVRAFKDGLLRSQMVGEEEFMPANDYPYTDGCTRLDLNLSCFQAGDKRVNEQPGLASIHNLFVRQHNRLARIFKEKYPTYNDDEIYNMTRRVVVAQYQNIVYGEFMTVLLGPKYMDYFYLSTGKDSIYMPDLEASIFNEFMTSALRFGHTLIQNTFERGPDDKSFLNLDEVYFSSFILMDGEFDPILKGLSSQPGKTFDTHLVTAVTHTMYRQKEVPFGMDLASLNIQRGRDQGTAPYVKYVKHCFNKNITSFEQLDKFMTQQNRMNLQKVYKHVEDIDLFTGGVSESSMTDAVVGPTFGCILGAQFYRLKYGDRFYFEHTDQTGSFKPDQLAEIQGTTLAQLICDNTRSVAKIASNVFKIESNRNNFKDCKDIRKFNATLF